MTALAIRLRHVTHRFGALSAVDDLSLDVQEGEIFGFIGPNGAGKTTTIRILSTLLEPTSGRVEVAGIDAVTDPELVRRVVGYMPDHSGVYERITVLEYLDFFAKSAGVSATSAIDRAIELTSIGDWRDRLVAALSKGMRQRLGLARVLLHDPAVLILDEPASDLDPRARVEMRELFATLRGLGKTIFLSSHILSELSDVCTSVGIIENGRLVTAGPIGTLGSRGGPPHPRASTGQGASRLSEPSPRAIPRQRLRIRVLGETGPLLAAVRAESRVSSAQEGPGGLLLVEHDGDPLWVAGLVKTLVDGGAAVIGVEPDRAELERVFLEMTHERRE